MEKEFRIVLYLNGKILWIQMPGASSGMERKLGTMIQQGFRYQLRRDFVSGTMRVNIVEVSLSFVTSPGGLIFNCLLPTVSHVNKRTLYEKSCAFA